MKTTNLINAKITTFLGVGIACLSAIIQIYQQGHPTLTQGLFDSAIVVIGILMNDGLFKVPEKVKNEIIALEELEKQLSPAIDVLINLCPTYKTKIQAVLNNVDKAEPIVNNIIEPLQQVTEPTQTENK